MIKYCDWINLVCSIILFSQNLASFRYELLVIDPGTDVLRLARNMGRGKSDVSLVRVFKRKWCNCMHTLMTDSGAIVQGHTNLTEIKLAAELFWRAKIPAHRIALGFGFYGRAFTLANPNCTTPGCPFSGGAKPGVCTKKSGCKC
jgi:chitinase